MSADFFKKRTIAITAGVAVFCVIIGICLYARYLDRATVEAFSQNYYFLVSDSTHVEASTHQIVLNGGAGYSMYENGRQYIAFASYLTATEAENVQKNIQDETQIITLSAKNLYFKKRKDKKNKKKIVGAFQTLSNCITVLNQEIVRLETGATQESCKRILKILEKQFRYMSKTYDGVFPSCAAVCQKAVTDLVEIGNETVYTSSLRSLQCELCCSYIRLAKEFSL
ncbi:MAG: hypothetical protein E7355_00210 [Clostridiales bacterium]|nr:hypothetical protein [Clostridiales bacterium]